MSTSVGTLVIKEKKKKTAKYYVVFVHELFSKSEDNPVFTSFALFLIINEHPRNIPKMEVAVHVYLVSLMLLFKNKLL